MNGIHAQKVALDSCVVIDIIEDPRVARGLKGRLRGKQIKVVLCDVVLGEVQRVRGFDPSGVISKIKEALNRKVEIVKVSKEQGANAEAISGRYGVCHNGDNKILSACQAGGMVLLTSDRMLLKTCSFVGVPGFHPSGAGGI